MKVSLVIGRFQPLHLGHVDLISKALEQGEKTLVLVGSSRQLPDFKNPFSYEERLELLERTFTQEETLVIRPLPDYPSEDEWIQEVTAHVLSLEEDPTEVVLYCHHKDAEYYSKNFLFQVEPMEGADVSATEVRHAYYTDTLWTVENKISLGVHEFLESHHDRERLTLEYLVTMDNHKEKLEGHPFGNPMEPVSFAVIIKGNDLLVGRRLGARGHGQLGLAGGYLQSDETSLDGCMREVKEELNLDLRTLIQEGKAKCVAQAVEENVGDLGTRSIGINYLFLLNPEAELNIEADLVETSEYQWLPVADILLDKTQLFFNHDVIVKRLLSKLGDI